MKTHSYIDISSDFIFNDLCLKKLIIYPINSNI